MSIRVNYNAKLIRMQSKKKKLTTKRILKPADEMTEREIMQMQGELPEDGMEVLLDIHNGRKVDWKDKKMRTLMTRDLYGILGNTKKARQLEHCSTLLTFVEIKSLGRYKLMQGNFCRNRMCPMCMWRRSLKIYNQIRTVIDHIESKEKHRYISLTLTVKNCSGDDLKETVGHLLKSFKRMTDYKAFKKLSRGWFRSLEVNYSWTRKDYHPHIHAIIAVPMNYFESRVMYLSKDKWLALWQRSARLDYLPDIGISAVFDKNTVVKGESDKERKARIKSEAEDGSINYAKAIAELAKYTVKDNDILGIKNREEAAQVLKTLDEALYKRRLAAFGDQFKKVHKLLNLKDPESETADLADTDGDEKTDEKFGETKYFMWYTSCRNFYRTSDDTDFLVKLEMDKKSRYLERSAKLGQKDYKETVKKEKAKEQAEKREKYKKNKLQVDENKTSTTKK